jgi:hypothetical protein
MGIYRGPAVITKDLVFGYDTGYGVADNSTATRFYPGENTTNLVTTNLETTGTDGSGQSSVGTRTTIAPNHVRIVDVTSNTRQSHLISGLTASTIYTVSIQFKKITGTPTFRFQLQGYSGGSYVNTIKFTSTAETGLEDIEGWQTAEWTFTLPSNCNALRIWWQDGADYTTYTHSFELKNPQLEAKNHVTPYVSGTRSSTASLIDLKRTTDIDVSNVSFDSTGQPTFDGSNDYITIPGSSGITSDAKTVEIMFKMNGSYSDFSPLAIYANGSSSTNRIWLGLQNNKFRMHGWGTVDPEGTTTISADEWYVCTFSYDKSTQAMKVYTNGVLETSTTNTQGGVTASSSLNWYLGTIPGGWQSVTYSDVDIPIFKLYNRILSDLEVKQNYNAYKNRFDI